MAQYLIQISQSDECGSKALKQQHPIVAVKVLEMLRKLEAPKVSISKTINNLMSFVCVLFLLANSKYNLEQLIMEKKVSEWLQIHPVTSRKKSIAK